MREVCLLICMVLCATNALAQEIKKPRKTVPQKERALPKPRNTGTNTMPLNATTRTLAPDIAAKPLSIADSIAAANHFWTAADSLNLRLMQPMPTQATKLSAAPSTDYSRSGQIGQWQGFSIYGQSYGETLPTLIDRQGAQLQMNRSWNNLSLSVYASADRYRTRQTTTQFGIGGSLTYRFSPYISATAFGSYYNVQPFLSMAAFPYVNSSAYGGYFTLDNGRWGLDVGAQRRYDAYRGTWIVAPIVTPKYHISKKFTIEIPVGDMARDILEKLVFNRQNHSPIIMPPRPFRP